ncbi:Transcription factor iws1 [Conglomerata obtusa]
MAKTAKKKTKEINEEELKNEANEIKKQMQQLLEQDQQSNKNNQPAMARLQNSENLTRSLKNNRLQNVLLDVGILDVIKQWMEPLPDNSLPNVKIKKDMLDVLDYLPVKRKHLLNGSGIGKIVNFYSKNVRENEDVRNLATKIVKKWTYFFVKEEDEDQM